jgi:hypothetical protein
MSDWFPIYEGIQLVWSRRVESGVLHRRTAFETVIPTTASPLEAVSSPGVDSANVSFRWYISISAVVILSETLGDLFDVDEFTALLRSSQECDVNSEIACLLGRVPRGVILFLSTSLVFFTEVRDSLTYCPLTTQTSQSKARHGRQMPSRALFSVRQGNTSPATGPKRTSHTNLAPRRRPPRSRHRSLGWMPASRRSSNW